MTDTDSARRGDAAPLWWRGGVVYQIYPRSFQDSNGDGIGDLRGILSRLDYLNDGSERSLGIDAIWLSPTFPSPMKDFGYDVSDYRGVHPDFGDLAAMDDLIAACHRRDIRLLLDFVPNHSSDQHPWFVESRSGRHNPKRDWYYWRDPAPGGGPPNNWVSAFGGGAWQWDAATGQYYLHSFLKEQPDLNWRNPEVVAAMHDTLRFWLRRGIDGFRIDVMGMVLKDPRMRDNPPNPEWGPDAGMPERFSQIWLYNRNWPEVIDAVRGIRAVLDEFPERMAVGEVFGPPETLAWYLGGEALDGLHLAFDFHLIGGYGTGHTPWNAAAFRERVDAGQAALPAGAVPAYVLGNHDQSRLVSRYGREAAPPAAMLLLTLPGTPFVYYGEEIGMADVPIDEAQARDPARHRAIGRDPERTPMQWDASAGAGFSSGPPWLPLGDPSVNVAAQTNGAGSLLSLYRRLIWLRKRSAALRGGSYASLAETPAEVFAFVREAARQRALVAINFAGKPAALRLSADLANAPIACSTVAGRQGEYPAGGQLELGPHEGCVLLT
ncbi:MAG TPA: alpha-amylase family glycosyl hydrolase [Dehalococcoidia bacterium]|nr:alpha-amylase family glycosyl hydrolase [Dehalococcoidia bacterium]